MLLPGLALNRNVATELSVSTAAIISRSRFPIRSFVDRFRRSTLPVGTFDSRSLQDYFRFTDLVLPCGGLALMRPAVFSCHRDVVTARSVLEFHQMATTLGRPDFPTMLQVENASHEQLARWYRFLPAGDTQEQHKIMIRIEERFKATGGMTDEISKKIGF